MEFTGPLPTELGRMTLFVGHSEWWAGFHFYSNQLCDDVPTQVQALSSSVTTGWQVTTDNSFGTVCGWQSYMADSRFPTMDGSTGVTSIDYNQQGLTGTIPTEVRVCVGRESGAGGQEQRLQVWSLGVGQV